MAFEILFPNSLGENKKNNLHERTQYQSGKNSNRHFVNRLWCGEDPNRLFSSTYAGQDSNRNFQVHLCQSGFKWALHKYTCAG